MATYADIGRATKAKYPAYEGKSDEEVGRAVVQKYPEYKSRLNTNSPVQNIAGYLGLKTALDNTGAIAATPMINKHTDEFAKSSQEAYKASNSLIQLAKKETDPVRKKALLDQSRSIMDGVNQKSQEFSRNLTKLQDTAGITEKDLGRSNVEFAARRGAGQTAELAAWLLPGMVGGKAASVGGRVLQAAERGAVAGGLQGVAGAAKDSENVLDAVKRLGEGAALGAGTGVALQGVVEGGAKVVDGVKSASPSIKQKLVDVYRGTLKQNIADQKFYKQYGGEGKVVEDVIKYKLPITKNAVTNELYKFKPEYDKIISAETDSLQQQGKRINLSQAFKRAEAAVKEKYGHDETLLKQAQGWFDANSKYKNMTNALPKTSNELRKKLDQKVGDILTSEAAPADAARKAFASELRKEFKNMASSETKDAIQRYHLLSGLSDAMQVEPRAGIVEATLAGVSPLSGLGNVAEFLAGKILRSPGTRRLVSTTGIKLAENVPQTSVNISKINPSVVINPSIAALQRAIDNETKSKQSRNMLP